MLITAGWISWAILLLFALGWSFGWYWKTRQPGGVTFTIKNTVIVWWVLLSWTLHYTNMNKLHLLWLAPSVVPLSMVPAFFPVMVLKAKGRVLPAGIEILLPIYIVLFVKVHNL